MLSCYPILMRWKLAYILALLWVMLCAPAQLWPRTITTTSTYNPDNSLATLATPAVATLTYGYDNSPSHSGSVK